MGLGLTAYPQHTTGIATLATDAMGRGQVIFPCFLTDAFCDRDNTFPLYRVLNDGDVRPKVVGISISFRKTT